jgi:hypothetical protein
MKTKHPENNYEKPKTTTYTEEEILELIGPACTISSFPGNGNHFGWGKGKGNPH